MLERINDPKLPGEIAGNQTTELLKRFRKDFPGDLAIPTMDRVVLMTPENIRIRPVSARFQAFSGCQFQGMSSSMRLIL
jgi:hypothetical protein